MTASKERAAPITAADPHRAIARLTSTGRPFEVGTRELGGAPYRTYTHASATLLDILAIGGNHGDTDFIVADGARWTFREYFRAVDAVARALQTDYGVTAGDRVAIAMRNCADWLIAFAAICSVGAVAVPTNSWGSSEELEYTPLDSEASLLFADLPRYKLAVGALQGNGIPAVLTDVEGLPEASDNGPRATPIGDVVLAHEGPTPTPPTLGPLDLAMLLYTSGSTGKPKGVCYRQVVAGQALMNMFLIGFLSLELGGTGVGAASSGTQSDLITVPLFHATGLFSGLLLPCMLCHKIALMRKWDGPTAMALIESERIAGISTVPAILKDLLTHPDYERHDMSSITRVAAAGAATPVDLPGLLQEKLEIASRAASFGMTETASVGATMSGPVFDLKPTSCGIPSPIIEIRIAESAADATHGDDGEVQLRGVTVTPGYWRIEAATREAFTADGWLRTGDLGTIDDDGFLHITGRIKELVIRGGENIAPIDIENAAYRHPSVREVTVVGLPDEAMGEELAMVCHPQESAQLDEATLRAHLKEHLPAHKVPRDITITPHPLPRNASEKIHRLAVRNSLLGA
ncbi:class I adenylate-forming enzyme family protein [Mycobacterium sp. GA-2829]|uniref:class I adenylate-forming enzyme family protein n=1 Tax=Mycobacterium sp. GA-2829 TaxID=1772283 RepID=UPI000740246A|nr:class I adenylate-forming enzyme family protein [Mycobacterium sp. GA-2829]KUI29321.1 hypothetical protein AU194_20850 [Mycobacterium sp. GA-2829]